AVHPLSLYFFLLLIPPPPSSPLFPYTTLFRSMYLGQQEVRSRDYSEATQAIVDEEVSRLLKEADERAAKILKEHRGVLDKVTDRSEEHTSELQSPYDLVCRLLLEKKKTKKKKR